MGMGGGGGGGGGDLLNLLPNFNSHLIQTQLNKMFFFGHFLVSGTCKMNHTIPSRYNQHLPNTLSQMIRVPPGI